DADLVSPYRVFQFVAHDVLLADEHCEREPTFARARHESGNPGMTTPSARIASEVDVTARRCSRPNMAPRIP
ncbi:hypothetical protein, partial [Chryseobacterium sp. SIMBA_028]|uniref:hypothetical protein n=1 Tax=Chryseobacterium sp. SIMBA_028 TaxID=3085771 RepID=UPI00397E1799